MKTRNLEIAVNVLFWLISGVIIVSTFSIQFQEVKIINGIEQKSVVRNPEVLRSLVVVLVFCALTFYFHVYNLHQTRFSSKRRIKMVYSILVAILFYALGAFMIYIFWGNRVTNGLLPLMALIFVFYFTIATIYGFSKLLIQNDRNAKLLMLEKNSFQLALLRRQLQPHFLFNALNNLLSMIDQHKNPELVKAVVNLSGLLRYVVEQSDHRQVTMAKEIEFVRNYVSMQRLRFEEDELICSVDVVGHHFEMGVEPGIFLIFVENAFKYGALPEKKSEVRIRFDIALPDKVFFSVENSKHPEISNLNEPGTGLKSIKERLELIYPGRYLLEITNGEKFIVELIIFAHANPDH